jgi:hypothetical protein
MDKHVKLKIELYFRCYWRNILRLKSLNIAIINIEKAIRELRNTLAKNNDLISLEQHGNVLNFTQMEKSISIYQSNQNKIHEKIKYLRKVWINKKIRVTELEYEIDRMKYIFDFHLNDIEKNVFEQCYCYRRSNVKIGQALLCDESTIRKKKEKILLTFYELLRLIA